MMIFCWIEQIYIVVSYSTSTCTSMGTTMPTSFSISRFFIEVDHSARTHCEPLGFTLGNLFLFVLLTLGWHFCLVLIRTFPQGFPLTPLSSLVNWYYVAFSLRNVYPMCVHAQQGVEWLLCPYAGLWLCGHKNEQFDQIRDGRWLFLVTCMS